MIFGAYAEIFCMDLHIGVAQTRGDAIALLGKAWEENGTHAIAIVAGDADEPMHVAMMIDADGGIWHGDDAICHWDEVKPRGVTQ